MNRKRGLLLGAAAVIGLGIVLILAGLWLMQFDIGKLDASRTVGETYEPAGEFRRIEVRVPSADIRLLRAEDGKTRVVTSHEETDKETVEISNGILRVSRGDQKGRFGHFGVFGSHEDSVTIYLPDAAYEALTVQTASGDMEIPAELTFDRAELATASGEIRFFAQCGELMIATVSGDVKLRGIAAEQLTLATVSGKADLEDVRAAGKLSVTTVSGDVELEYCDAGELELHTTSGEIEGTLLTPKRFDVHTASGEIDVPASHTGAGLCAVHTTSGDVELKLAR